MTNTLTKLKEHFTAAELAAFNPEQLEIIIKSMIPSQEKSLLLLLPPPCFKTIINLKVHETGSVLNTTSEICCVISSYGKKENPKSRKKLLKLRPILKPLV